MPRNYSQSTPTNSAGGEVHDISNVTKLLFSVPDAAKALSVGKTTVWGLVKAGSISTVKVAGRTLIAADELNRYVDHLTHVS